MNDRRDSDPSAYEEALELLRGHDSDSPDRAEAEYLEPVIAMLREVPREAWKAPTPPRIDLASVTERKADRPETRAGDRTDRTRRFRMPGIFAGWPGLVAGAAAAVALVAIGVVFGVLLGGDRLGSDFSPSERVALAGVAPEAPAGALGEVLVADSGGEPIELDVSGLRPNAEGEYYEFWLLGAKGELVSLGSFRVDDSGESKVRLPLPVDPADYGYFDVSIEKEDGSPDHSGKSVLRGLTKA